MSDLTYKLFFFGDTKVGKTSFILRMSEGSFEDNIVATMGCDSKIKKTLLENNQNASIEMWDTAGQERFKSIARNLIKKADGVVLIYSITDRTSFENVTEWLNDIKSVGQYNIPIILVGNKCDLKTERQVSTEEGIETSKSNGIDFFEASCKENFNLSTIFDQAVKSIYLKKQTISQQPKELFGRISIQSEDLKMKQKKCC